VTDNDELLWETVQQPNVARGDAHAAAKAPTSDRVVVFQIVKESVCGDRGGEIPPEGRSFAISGTIKPLARWL
jgi:hypothetical protein